MSMNRSIIRQATCCLVALFGLTACEPQAISPPQTASIDDVSATEPADDDPTVSTESAVSAEPESQPAQSEESDQVLRHAVFFSFKETSGEDDIQQVVDAFRALPGKIDAITDFAWGTNNSPEGLDDGFSHCFLLTFADEDGRAVYLPHAEHKAFGDVLRPHMDKVFVIDYWGSPQETPIDPALKHAVFFKFKDDAAAADVQAVEEAFAALPTKIDEIKAFEWGRNNSPEKHDDGFTHCFMVTFASEDGRAAYLPHEAHQAFVKLLEPALDKVRVLDFAAQQ